VRNKVIIVRFTQSKFCTILLRKEMREIRNTVPHDKFF